MRECSQQRNAMIEQFLQSQLAPATARQRHLLMARGACAILGTILFVAGSLYLAGIRSNSTAQGLLILLAGSLLLVKVRTNRWNPDLKKLAREIEAENPQLQALLLTAVDLKVEPGRDLNFMERRLLHQTVQQIEKYSGFQELSAKQLRWYRSGQWSFIVALAFLILQFHETADVTVLGATLSTSVQVFPAMDRSKKELRLL
jgi:hypothetical protein